MRHVVLLSMLLPAAALAAPQAIRSNQPPPREARCERANVRQVAAPQLQGPRKLGDMPPAKAFYTVLREIDGCPQPVNVPAR